MPTRSVSSTTSAPQSFSFQRKRHSRWWRVRPTSRRAICLRPPRPAPTEPSSPIWRPTLSQLRRGISISSTKPQSGPRTRSAPPPSSTPSWRFETRIFPPPIAARSQRPWPSTSWRRTCRRSKGAAEQTGEDAVAAYEAAERGDVLAAAGHTLAAVLSFAGVVPGVRVVARYAGRGLRAAAETREFGRKIIASRELGKAMNQGATPLPAQGVRGVVGEEAWRSYSRKHRGYAKSIYNIAKGRVTEKQMRDRLETLGAKPVSRQENATELDLQVISPKDGKFRNYDEIFRDRNLKSILGFAISLPEIGRRIAVELKADLSKYTKRQSTIDHEITEAAKAKPTDQKTPEDVIDRGHNNPPELIALGEGLKNPHPKRQTSTTSNNATDLVDTVILMRIRSSEVETKQFVDTFRGLVENPKGIAQKRIRSGEWTEESMYSMIEDIRKGLEARNPDLTVIELMIGITIRLLDHFEDEKHSPSNPN